MQPTMECQVRVPHGRGCRQALRTQIESVNPSVPPGRVPRIARLMALALKFEQLLRQGVIANYAELACLGQVTRARITQIMNLLQLAPDLQEEILFLPRTRHGRDPFHVRQLQPLTQELDWRKQRQTWRKLYQESAAAKGSGRSLG
jgi:hypothetical protein